MKDYMNKTIMILTLSLVIILLIKSFIPQRKDELLKYKLKQLDIQIDSLKKQQVKLINKIDNYKKDILKIDSSITNIRASRTTINNFYEIKEDSIKGMERKQIILELKKRYKY
jgi:peptidoglycan hydrolase CwlO-like protein